MKTKLSKYLFSASILLTSFVVAAEQAPRPNILLVLTDDQGYADVGFSQYASKDIQTPNLDALANSGVTFDSAYVAHPFCGPSRAALMTGRYPHKIGSQFNLPVNGSDTGIDTNEEFISKSLQKAGYFTGAIGKWHLGEQPQYHPNVRGFDEFYGFLGGGHKFFPADYQPRYEHVKSQGVKFINDYITPLVHNDVEVRETEYLTDAFSREAVNFITKAADDKSQPFFLYLAYNAPHVPLEAKEEDLARFKHIKDKKRRTYAAMVYAVDRGISEIVKTLKDTGQYDNTFIVFLSDNGGKVEFGGVNKPLREGKGSAREGGHRVPMMMHWPAKLKPGKRYPHPVSSLDFYPTFMALAGAKIPEDKTLDGKDIWSHIEQGSSARKGESLYVLRHRKAAHDVSVRRDQWKAVRTKVTGKWQLFNIELDIAEKNDLAKQHPEILQDLVNDIAHWSWSNVPPKWFHQHWEGDQWRKDNMPKFGETFTVD
ncbi:sulfatase-like hydrolase/transferase [Aliiglaciecola sp. 3_MG-2023]|uniref:sulfatase-like hydrolase/transferase n=1 Tax=Aliiglaciecola sp. 3_MG-2023 TaxID=3062644 RepID=UPI0026E422B0|nr:sulfatase-like hydrolase/transferase [Aliiglaciecola sp. 3_MG-2023]MDO6693145.1 sulfatase-like hydrolase/transferase [Aliiglaciecola sp. 3_MG-2023]